MSDPNTRKRLTQEKQAEKKARVDISQLVSGTRLVVLSFNERNEDFG